MLTRRIGRVADQPDDLIQVRHRDGQHEHAVVAILVAASALLIVFPDIALLLRDLAFDR